MDKVQAEIEAIRKRVNVLRTAGWRKLSKASKVPFGTIRKFAYGEVKCPRTDTMKRLEPALKKMEAR